MNITKKYDFSYKWKVHHGIYKTTMKLFKTCMIVVSIHCHSGLEFLDINA
jgi:hypothetical protein